MTEEQKYTMSKELIRMFRQVVPGECGELRSFTEVNELAIKRGYVVVPEACTELVTEWLEDERFDPNATFYKEWKDIQERSAIDLLFDQLTHYLTTYGTDFSLGNGYVPNDGKDRPLMEFSKLKAITVTTAEEMTKRCIDMLRSGVALKDTTVTALVDYVVAHGGCDADSVANKEAACILHARQGTHPSDPTEYVRYLVYRFTGKTLLIKSYDVIREIESRFTADNELAELFSKMAAEEIDTLATVYYRFKPLILAMKRNIGTMCDDEKTVGLARHAINRIRARARKLKQPFTPGVLDTVCVPGDHERLERIRKHVDGAGMFRKFRLLQCVVDRAATLSSPEDQVYNIRNGKTFIRHGYSPKSDMAWLKHVQAVIVGSISSFLDRKAKTRKVKLPAEIDLTLPTSEKSFLGDYPLGSRIPLSDNNIVGVYWRNEWGTRDFDLSMVDDDGTCLSWHTELKNGEYMHSGDMTNADPEASECIYFPGNSMNGMVFRLNQFNGSDPNGKFRFFVARHDGKPKFNRGYMVDPKDIVFTTDANVVCKQTAVAVVCDGHITLLGRGFGASRVTFPDGSTTSSIATYTQKNGHAIRLASLFALLGFEVVHPDYEGEVDLDLSDPKRDTLISFFTEEAK